MTSVVCILYRKNPYEERYDKVKVNEYMDLVNLAKVLDELTKIFPGKYVCIMYTILSYVRSFFMFILTNSDDMRKTKYSSFRVITWQ